MWRALSGIGPGMFQGVNLLGIPQALADDQTLQCVGPVHIVGIAKIGVTGILCRAYGRAQRSRPFRPSEHASFVQGQRHGKGLGLPRGREHRAIAVVGQAGHGHDVVRVHGVPCRFLSRALGHVKG